MKSEKMIEDLASRPRMRGLTTKRGALLIILSAFVMTVQSATLSLKNSYVFDFGAVEMQFDVSRQCAYLTDFNGYRLLKVSLTNGAVLTQFAFTNRPAYAALAPSRQRLYVSLWTPDLRLGNGSVAEFDLDTFSPTAAFPVSVRPTFIVATDNRLVVVSDSGPGFTRLKSYSAATGAELDSISGSFAYYGNRLAMHPSQSALYAVPLDATIPTTCIELRRFNTANGDISFPSPFFDGRNQYCPGDGSVLTGVWVLPGGTRLLLSNADVLDVAPDPVMLSFRQRLEQSPAHLAVVDSVNQALFTVSLGGPNLVHQFHLDTLDYRASFELTNAAYYWGGAAADTLWFGRLENGQTFLEAYANPASARATNRPPLANAGPDQTVECLGVLTTIMLDGRASNDPDDTNLAYRWTENGLLLGTNVVQPIAMPSGAHTITLEVRDPSAAASQDTVQVRVVDTAPPQIQCPGDLMVEFTGTTGAVVNFFIMSTDVCSTASTECFPPTGSTFPIGTSRVTCVATDTRTNRAACEFNITVKGGHGVKQAVLAEMSALRGVVTNFHEVDRLDEAIENLTAALDHALWLDETHLTPVLGDKVFNYEKHVVTQLQEMMQDRQSSLPESLLVAFTVRLLKVDRLLAEISVDEAAAGGASPKKIEQEQVARGDADASEGRAESAIEHYRNAWKHAIRLRKD